MKTIELKSRKLLRKIFNSFSITAVAFIFQACYGPGPDARYCDLKLTGTVISRTTSLPIPGIKVAVNEWGNFGITDENGKFDFYASIPDCCNQKGLSIQFLDIDGAENGNFVGKTIPVDPACKNEVTINAELDELK